MSDTPNPSRSDLKLVEQALRNDWPIPQSLKTRLLQIAINIADPMELDDDQVEPAPAVIDPTEQLPGADPADEPTADDLIPSNRLKIAALRVIAQFSRLSLEQQRLDLLRDKLEGNAKGFNLADAVAEAERQAASYSPDVKPT